MDSSETLLSTSHLSIGYASKKETTVVFDAISLNFSKGKLVTIIGENGIGKSTFLKTLTGILKPLSGKVLLNSKEIITLNSSQLAQEIAVVLTEKLPPSQLTVFELIALGRQPYINWVGTLSNLDLDKINQAIQLTGIEHLKNKKITQISDGQLQIALITRALAQDTQLIILDEPTTHLDIVHKVAVFKLLKKIAHETQKCVLLSTHDIDLSIHLSDEIVVFLKDKIVHDSPKNLIEKDIFNTLFQDENITFDATKGRFIFL